MAIAFEIKNITPAWADEIMTKHYEKLDDKKMIQRPLSLRLVSKYAAEIDAGFWKLQPQPVAFDTEDNLFDGQHRLAAVVKTRKTVPMVVTTGWPVEKNGAVGVMDVVDTGKPRSIPDMLHMHGMMCARNVTTTVRYICVTANRGSSLTVTYSQTVHLLDKLGLSAAIDRIVSKTSSIRDFQGSLVGPLAYYYTSAPKKAMQFAEDLFHFEATKGSPVQAFLTWQKNHTDGRREVKLRAIAACLRAWDGNEQLEIVRATPEAAEWLANTNEKLRKTILTLIPPQNNPGHLKVKAS